METCIATMKTSSSSGPLFTRNMRQWRSHNNTLLIIVIIILVQSLMIHFILHRLLPSEDCENKNTLLSQKRPNKGNGIGATNDETEEEGDSPPRKNGEQWSRYNNNEKTPLPDLVGTSKPLRCPTNTVYPLYPVEQVSNAEAEKASDRRIPRVVHLTGKTRCLTRPFYENVEKWKFENHSFYFHDDDAVDRLLFGRHWPLFPQLRNSMECLKHAGGAAKADVWRYLLLWEYGGIYTDTDNAPGELFNASTIPPDTDAMFVMGWDGFASQYFIAVSPHHPLMFLAVHQAMGAAHELMDTGGFYVPRVTGPNCIKNSILLFMGYNPEDPPGVKDEIYKRYAKPKQGTYIGKTDPDRGFTIVGSRKTNSQWLHRSVYKRRDKVRGFEAMNITDYKTANQEKRNISCVMTIYKNYKESLLSSER